MVQMDSKRVQLAAVLRWVLVVVNSIVQFPDLILAVYVFEDRIDCGILDT